MRQRHQTMLEEVLPPEERAIEAVVARYQRVAPAVTRFARAIAGNDQLLVRLGSRASTGNDEIVLDPGVFQSAYSRSAPVTPTEVALTSALHEAVHLIATDLEELRPIPEAWLEYRELSSVDQPPPPVETPAPLVDTLSLFDFRHGDGFDEERLDDIDDEDAYAYSAAAHDAAADLLSPPAGAASSRRSAIDAATQGVRLLDALEHIGGDAAVALFMALEDARQEVRHLTDYGGVRSVLSDLYRAAVPDAMRRAGPLGQFALGCFLIVGDYHTRDEIQRRCDAHVAAAVDEAMEFIDDIPLADDPWHVGTAALNLLAVARRHGLVTEGEVSPSAATRKLMDDADANAISDSVDAVRLMTPSLHDADSYEDTRQASQTVSAESARHGEADHAGDPATEQLVRVSESPTVFLPTGQGGKLVVGRFPDRFRQFGAAGRNLIEDAASRWGVAQRRVSGELYPLFLANQRRGLRSGFDAGDLSPYAALLLGGGIYDRMFERRDMPMRRSYGVSLLVDGSASMLQPRSEPDGRKSPWAMAAASLGAWTLARLCNELQIDFEVALFNRSFAARTDDTERSFSDRRHRATGALRRTQGGAAERLTRTVNHYLVKSFDERWRASEDLMAGLFWTAAQPGAAGRSARLDPETAPPVSMFDKAANVDEFNLAFAAGRLGSRSVATRILVVLADGMTRGSVQSLADSVDAIEHAGTTVLGIGIGDTTVQAAYARNEVVERPDELASAMVDGVRSTLFRTLASMGGHGWWSQKTDLASRELVHMDFDRRQPVGTRRPGG